ncbi:MAG: efflux RND transporter periplasmic adaptor subunit [Desulfobacteria bacterium]
MRTSGNGYAPPKWSVALTALASLLLVGGCQGGKERQTAQAPVPEVATLTVSKGPVALTTVLPGRVSAYRIAEIRPQVTGLIRERLFTEGSRVRSGQVLYRIDPAPFQAALENAKAALGKAEANLQAIRSKAERFKELLPDKAVSRQDYDDAAAALKQTEADIEAWKATVRTAEINLGYTRVVAPISGRIGRSDVSEGALVTAQQPTPLSVIQQLDPVYVDVPQSTAETLRLKRSPAGGRLNQDGAGQKKVKLVLEDGAAYPLTGTLQFRDVTVDPTTGSVLLRIVVPNPDNVLLPGMFVRAVVFEGIKEQAILIPQQAVARDPKGDPFALIVDAGGKVRQRMLVLERAIGDKWLVSSGLASGDRVIAEGMQRVRPGASVKEVPFAGVGKEGSKPESKALPASKSN